MGFRIGLLLLAMGASLFCLSSAQARLEELKRHFGGQCRAPLLGTGFSDSALMAIDEFARISALVVLGRAQPSQRDSDASEVFFEEASFLYSPAVRWSEKIIDLINVHLRDLGTGLVNSDLIDVPEVFLLTHVTSAFQGPIAQFLRSPDRIQIPVVALASDAAEYVVGPNLLNRANYVHYSDSGEFKFQLKADVIHFMGGNFEHCLKTTVQFYLKNNLLKCPNCRAPKLLFHLDQIYRESSNKLMGGLDPGGMEVQISSFMRSMAQMPEIVSQGGNYRYRFLVDTFGREIPFIFQ